ncbi:MAG: FAD:protein FMN transferase, partial [Rhizobacter sp.]|nr:FAD:protein FMN transferase [Rhizobacter sp.]
MASTCEVRIGGVGRRRGTALAAHAIAEVRRIEAKYSRYRADSIVSRVNASAGSGRAVAVDA